MVYESGRNKPNAGKNAQEQIEACSKACLANLPGTGGESWTGFVALGFCVNFGDGDCWCESNDSATCERKSFKTRARYDFIGE